MEQQTFENWLAKSGLGGIASRASLSGGDICKTEKITTGGGRALCVKQLGLENKARAPKDFFKAEAVGLRALVKAQAEAGNQIRVPEVVGQGDSFIAMAYIAPGQPEDTSWLSLAEGLALMHGKRAPHFGFEMDNYCGHTPQSNHPCDDGYAFFAEQRLLFQARLAHNSRRFGSNDIQRLETLIKQLPELVPEQMPCLVHGDLWSGNVFFDGQGRPVIIDPACYYGWAEADLAMTALFGGFSEAFYRHYQVVNPLQPGWRERFPIYNLYHLLNHLNLFGGHYYQQAMAVIKRYG